MLWACLLILVCLIVNRVSIYHSCHMLLLIMLWFINNIKLWNEKERWHTKGKWLVKNEGRKRSKGKIEESAKACKQDTSMNRSTRDPKWFTKRPILVKITIVKISWLTAKGCKTLKEERLLRRDNKMVDWMGLIGGHYHWRVSFGRGTLLSLHRWGFTGVVRTDNGISFLTIAFD